MNLIPSVTLPSSLTSEFIGAGGALTSTVKTSWRDRLGRASFRGMEFLTEDHQARSGRRLVLHEMPGADEPLVEDLGAKANEYKLTAYFIGNDYDQDRDQFLVKLNTPGAAWLIHPWLGNLWVRVHGYTLSERNAEGSYCSIAIDFVPGGETPTLSTADRVDTAYSTIADFQSAIVSDFSLESLSSLSMTSMVAVVSGKLGLLRGALSMATLPLTWANRAINLVQSAKNDLSALLALPSSYANALLSLSNALGFADEGDDDLSDTAVPRVIKRLSAAATQGQSVKLTGLASTDAAVRLNLIQEQALRQRLVVAAMANLALVDYRAAEDRDTVLDTVVSAIDALLPSASDTVFQAAVNARAAVVEALLALDVEPATTRDVVARIPAVVLAHRLEVDEDVFLARNRVRHPLFVSGRVYG